MSGAASFPFGDLASAAAERLGLVRGRSNLEEFAETLLGLARADRNVLAVTSDSRGSARLGSFATELPEQLVEVGVAEQNLVGVAAGLAAAGKTVFAVSPASFLTARALEQIKNDVAYANHTVTLVGISAGVSYGALGSTHHSLHDLAALRAIHNLVIVVPADNAETRSAVKAAALARFPVYLRFGKAPLYDLPSDGPFVIGRARMLRDGADVAFIATGETVIHALLAAAQLEGDGLSCRVLSMHTIKPLDDAAVVKAARDCRAVLTVEEHMVSGGLGEACAGLLAQAGLRARFKIVALPSEETVTGSQAEVFRHYGLTMEGLAQAALDLVPGPSLFH